MNILQSQTGRIGISAVVMAMIIGAWAGGVPGTAVAADDPPPCGQGATSPHIPTPFVDNVGQPAVAVADSANHFTLSAHMDTHSFATGWPAVPTMGYDAVKVTGGVNTVLSHMAYLGPTIVTKKGIPIQVTIKNDLPAGVDLFPQWGMMQQNTTVLHRHGGLQPALSDGTPDQMVAPGGGTRTNYYPNNQAAAPIWYHDHADMTTSFNVYAGLAGYMPNTDTLEPTFKLPTGAFSKAYVLQDKSFNDDNADGVGDSLCYSHGSPEFFGDTPVINGTISPKQEVEARKYMFTFINGSDSRFYNLSMKPAEGNLSTIAPKMTVVGSDDGYLFNPTPVTSLLIANGERYTVVVNFKGTTGNWVLSNDAATPYPGDNSGIASSGDAGALLPSLMRFDVSKRTSPDSSEIPSRIFETNNQVTARETLATAQLRTVQAGELAPGVPFLGDAKGLHMFHDATVGTTENIDLGSTEAWEMRNHSPDTHPMHTHLAEQLLVGRYPVTLWGYKDSTTGTLVTGPLGTQDPVTGNAYPVTLGAFQAPGAWEKGPKDTFVTPPNMVTVYVAKFTIPGDSVWHCHILSHEDMMMTTTSPTGLPVKSDGMMRPTHIAAGIPQKQLPVVRNLNNLDKLVAVPAGF